MTQKHCWMGGLMVVVFALGLGCAGPGGKRPGMDGRTGADKRPGKVRFALATSGLPDLGMWKCDPEFVDVNEDGNLDLVAHPRLGDGPHIWLGNGKGAWTDWSEGLVGTMQSCGGGVGVRDLNGDSLLDLAVADHCNGVFVYLRGENGGWEQVTKELYPAELASESTSLREFRGAEDIDIADINDDGFPDLITGASDAGGINVYVGDGTGANWTRLSAGLPTRGWVNRVVAADVNADGKMDIVASESIGPRVWLGDGTGNFSPASEGLPTPMIQGLFSGLAVGDLNEDGLPDFAVANWVDGPEAYLQQPDGSWRKGDVVFPELLGGGYALALTDIDRDGHLDIVFSGRLTQDVGYVYGVFVLRGDGRARWEYQRGSNLPETGLSFTFGLATGDFNGDGLPDIAAASGGIVATEIDRTEPVVPARMLTWTTNLNGAARTASSTR